MKKTLQEAKVMPFPGGQDSMLQVLDDLRDMVERNEVRYVFFAAIDGDGCTRSQWAGHATLIERLGLLELCKDSELEAGEE